MQPLSDQQELIDDIRAQINPPDGPAPPPGTTVELAGLPVLAAEANTDLSHSRWWLPLVGLLAVGIVLALVYRSVRRAVVPLIPVLMATGWSGLVVAALGISLNPMSATLGALVIAIATEFSVILSARYATERRAGRSVGEALRRTYLRTGAAVLASGITAIAGFAVLAIAGLPLLDDIGLISVAPVLRDFGLVTVADLLVALAGVMLVLPAAVVWAEEGFPLPSRTAGPGRRPANPSRKGPLSREERRWDRRRPRQGAEPAPSPDDGLLADRRDGVHRPDRHRRHQHDLDEEQGRPWGDQRGRHAAGAVRGAGRANRARAATPTSPRTTATRRGSHAPPANRRIPACQVDVPGALRVCDFFDRPLVLSFWFTRGGDCENQEDVFERAYRRYRGRVNFLAVDVRDGTSEVQKLIREHHWTHPVGLDRDGALSNLYRVGGCPTFVYAYPGGVFESTSIGKLDDQQFFAKVDALIAASKQRAATVR